MGSTGSKDDRGKPNAATEYYVSGEGMYINQFLRGRVGEDFQETDFDRKFIKDLDKATDGKITDDTLYRSVDATAIFGRMDDYDYSDMRAVLNYGENAFGKGEYAKKKANVALEKIKNAIGKDFTEKGYMSTTASADVAENWGGFTGASRPIVLQINNAKNARGVDLSGYDKNVDADEAQHERLLARNQSFTVKNVRIKNGNIYVEVDMKKR